MKKILFLLMAVLSAQNADTTAAMDSTQFPAVETKKEKAKQLPTGEQFFDYKGDLGKIQTQIDSLKKVIKVLEKKKAIPTVNEELLNLIKIPELQHRIELTNGTVIIGEIIDENAAEMVIQTSIGKLSIEQDKVVKIEKDAAPAPKIELMNEPVVSVYPDREVISGTLINRGKIRADFVRIIANLWSAETELVRSDSAFAQGTLMEYKTGVATDTAIEPGATARFNLTIGLKEKEPSVAYRTFAIHWMEAK